MTTPHTNPLAGVVSATAAGERLVFVPHRIREVGTDIVLGAVTPPVIAVPVLIPILGVALGTGFWAILWAAFGLIALAMIVVVPAAIFMTLTEKVRWIEFRPHGSTEEIVIAYFLRSSTVATADLQRVVLSERFGKARAKSLDVVLHTRGGKVECKPGVLSPMSRVSAEALLDWLTSRLGPAGTAVEHRTEIDRSAVRPDGWYSEADLAALWNVPADEVDKLVVRHGIDTYTFTPRAAALYSPAGTTTVYDPAGAHEVAEKLRRKRTTSPPVDGIQETPPL
ncbi:MULTISPECIES: PrgI family protein [Streptomyces]|uniref:PrgI family protein n=1 Tax=Streptomyces TaxID=1883 RepID=UPI000F76CB27|nr:MULTISPECIES: PrgI family protein [Streptomyces]RSS99041.1 PrgI family protein [Streptomyces sp. WAC07149]GLX31925.1 hypothetical protein Slala02_77440 [Streptomyces lavendulae subsp. lavendulae]